MPSSSAFVTGNRDRLPSLSPISPTVRHSNQRSHRHRSSRHASFRHHTYRHKLDRRPTSSIWERHRSSTGRWYYYNPITDQSQWEKPSAGRRAPINNHHIRYRRTSSRPRRSSRTRSIGQHQRRRRRTDHPQLFPEAEKSTPTSPPAHEIIPLDHVDPFPTIHSEYQLYTDIFQFLHRKQSIKTFFHQQISLTLHSSSTDTNFDVEHSNGDDITRYYRGELIEHLLNWPMTQLERDSTRITNEQTRICTYQLISLRTQIYFLRLRFERNRFYLLHYYHQQDRR